MPSAVPEGRTATAKTDWAAVTARILEDNAGIRVDRIAQRGPELLVYGEQTKFFYGSKGLGRAARILDNRLDSSIDWITFVSENHGIADRRRQRPSAEASSQYCSITTSTCPPCGAASSSIRPQRSASRSCTQQPLKRCNFGLSPGFAQEPRRPERADPLSVHRRTATATYRCSTATCGWTRR